MRGCARGYQSRNTRPAGRIVPPFPLQKRGPPLYYLRGGAITHPDPEPSAKIGWRRPGAALDSRLPEAFSLPPIGSTGDLPRNAGRGPSLFTLDLSVTREFRLSERARLRPVIELDNLLNKTVFTFGAEFINFSSLRPSATEEQRRAFADTFLVPTRTLRPRTVRLGVRFDF